MTEYTVQVHKNVGKFWWLNGRLHRTDGPAVEYAGGDKEWYLDGLRHRVDGPAVEWEDGDKSWYLNGKRHREDGPACEWADGRKAWFLNGEYLTEAEFNLRTKSTCVDKEVVIDGVRYQLTAV